MAFSLDSISKGAQVRAPRMVLLGVEKIGKTTFACGSEVVEGKIVRTGINDPIVIPVRGEEGADALDVGKFPTCEEYDQVLDAIRVLGEETHEYKTAVLDSASALEPIIWKAVCKDAKTDSIEKVGGGYGKGYIEALSRWRKLLEYLDALRDRSIATIIIGHVKVKRFDDPAGESYDQYQFDINDKAANLLYRWSDIIGFCNTKTHVKKEETGFGTEKKKGSDPFQGYRFLYTQKRPAHPGGGRGVYGQLPYELPLDWQSFENAVANAISGVSQG